jgi:hypothetical protein
MADVSAQIVYVRREDVVLREVAGEHILVPIRSSAADMQAIFALNRTGLRIWQLLDGARRFDEVLAAMTDRYEVAVEEARADLGAFLAQLLAAALVERRD